MGKYSKTIEIDIKKKYIFPEIIRLIHYKSKIIVISVETACWIVLDNVNQLSFFNLLKTYTIQDAIELFKGSQADVQSVLIQIEARKFESKQVNRTPYKQLQIYLTNQCNLRCPHCYMYANNARNNELSTDEIKYIFKEFHKSGGENVILTGGEISLRKDLIEIIKCANNIGLKIELLTNGTLWSDSDINTIAPLISRIQISIDGFSEENNSKVRGKGNFQKALETIDKFITKNTPVEIAITPLYNDNLKNEYIQYAHFGKFMKNKYRDYNLKIKYTTSLLDGRDLNLSLSQKEEYRIIMNKVQELYYNEDITDYPFINSHKRRIIFDNCAFGCMNISSIGEVYACSVIPKLQAIGNIRKEPFKEILEKLNRARNFSNINNLQPCKQCELKYICGGGCRIIFFNGFTDYEDTKINVSPERKCDENIKHEFYELMIRTNHFLFE